MKAMYRSAMETLYFACMAIAGFAVVLMTLIIPYGVFMRYVVNAAASWPEPLAILMMIVFTFFGATACYRANVHIAVTVIADTLPATLSRYVDWLVAGLLGVLSAFMIYWGSLLVAATWHQVMAEFMFLRVGITYLPIPIGGAITLLFIIERIWLGPPAADSIMFRETASTD